MKSKQRPLTELDREVLKECGDTLHDALAAGGIGLALAYLKEHVLVSPFAKSQRFLRDISRLESMRQLLSKLPPEEADGVREILRKEVKQWL